MRFKIMGLCLAAAFVMSAVPAGSAMAAAPEFLFTSSSVTFTSKAGKLETSSGEEVNCTSSSGAGEFEGTSPSKKITKVTVSYHGCTSKILTNTYKCKTAGANEEEIKTRELEGTIGYINKNTTPREIGLLFQPKGGGNFAEFECVHSKETVTIRVKGSIIGKITPVNTLVDLFAGGSALIDMSKGANKGEPSVNKFEGAAEDELLTESTISKKFEKSAIEDSITVLGPGSINTMG
jgi:hypothetical protein